MKQFFAYIRVSTVRQGEKGVSLQEQKDAIESYAHRNGIEICQWFEERETAAKHGRPVFTQMLRLLRKGKAPGVIIHKIDRSARNLRDWVEVQELKEQGIEVHFAHESVDLNTRGGSLAADIQAVVAADFIRALRDEVKKGIYGRLKQGFYPLPAPVGYVDKGMAKAKEIDPTAAMLVKQMFELYSSGRYGITDLREEMHRRGLRNRRGGKFSRDGISGILNNPFYVGVMRIKKTGDVFQGNHEPLVTKALFDRVQRALRGKCNDRVLHHSFIFRRMIRCGECAYSLSGELKKGHIYYRCHIPTCPTTGIREEAVTATLEKELDRLQLNDKELTFARQWVARNEAESEAIRLAELKGCQLRLDQLKARRQRLADALLDGDFDRQMFEERKSSLLFEQKEIEEKLAALEEKHRRPMKQLQEFFELLGTLSDQYKIASSEEKRDLFQSITSNLTVSQKNVYVELKIPFKTIAKRSKVDCGGPQRDGLRTWDGLLRQLLQHFISETGVSI
jgi:DNA invertase Pin-like site-specific DNA recombinase